MVIQRGMTYPDEILRRHLCRRVDRHVVLERLGEGVGHDSGKAVVAAMCRDEREKIAVRNRG